MPFDDVHVENCDIYGVDAKTGELTKMGGAASPEPSYIMHRLEGMDELIAATKELSEAMYELSRAIRSA